MFANNACWHKSCRRPFDSDKVRKSLEKLERKEEVRNELTIQPSKRRSLNYDNCLFCEKGEKSGKDKEAKEKLRFFTDPSISKKLKEIAEDLQDTELMVRVDGPDLYVRKARYHLICYQRILRKHEAFLSKDEVSHEEILEARAISELYGYIEESVEDGEYLFKLQDLHDLLMERLKCFDIEKEKNRTQLKEKILFQFPNAIEQKVGKNVIIAFPEGVKQMMKEELKRKDHSYKLNIVAQTAKIVREEAMQHKHFPFNGTFDKQCQIEYIPPTLQALVSMILNGVNIKDVVDDSQQSLTIAQLLQFNMRRSCPKKDAKTYHKADQEPPLCTYVSMKIHSETRNKALISVLNFLGLSPSYDRVLKLADQYRYAVCEQYNHNGVVVPTHLPLGRKYWSAIDNVDHNLSSTTANDSFHGTSISLFGVGSSVEEPTVREKVKLPPKGTTHELPESYTIVPHVEVQSKNLKVPWRARTFDTPSTITENENEKENGWLKKAFNLLPQPLTKEHRISWPAYFAANQQIPLPSVSSQALLPLFHEKVATISMLKHGMNIVKSAIAFLNPTQIPLLTGDQPVFALGKKVQWLFPEEFGEDRFVMWPGGLHVEMAFWKLLGDLLEGTGWDSILSEAGVATPGVAKSMLKVSHLMRTRHAHQVVLLALHALKRKAWDYFQETGRSRLTYDEWINQLSEKSPTIFFWELICKLVRKVLMFVRSHRERNFYLYMQTMKELVPLFFSLDHMNYSRWMSVHIRDLCSLPESVLKMFCDGDWVIAKTKKRFSTIPVDQAHEQNNKSVKATGGFIGLTENQNALNRWMIAGPAQAEAIAEFEQQVFPVTLDADDEFHHQEGLSAQARFQQQVKSVIDVIESKGNPYLDNFAELVTIDTRKVIDSSVAESLKKLENLGVQCYDRFRKDVLEDRIVSIDEPIKRNNLPLAKNPRLVVKTKQSQQVRYLRMEVELFAKLWLSTREPDRDKFFSHEHNPFPVALSDNGKMHFPSAKSDLLQCLHSNTDETSVMPKHFDCAVLDGAAIVHFMAPDKKDTNFQDYAKKRFLPYLEAVLKWSDRLDLVFDQYYDKSLKNAVREKRGSGIRYKVQTKVKLPPKWSDFLFVSENKKELFHFLAREIEQHKFETRKQVTVTMGSQVLTINSPPMQACTHEEADSRILIHILDGLEEGHNSFLVRTVDTDVVVICMAKFHNLVARYPDINVWIKLGSGTAIQNIHLNSLCKEHGESICQSVPIFHTLTGCDTTSSFKGKAKKSAWQAWKSYPAITPIFQYLSQNPFFHMEIESSEFKVIQNFIVHMYSKNMEAKSVNEGRKLIFALNQNMEKIPPTEDALLQHVKRAIYQSGSFNHAIESKYIKGLKNSIKKFMR